MQIAPEQGAFLTLLTRLIGARSAIEVGTFTGYSSLCIARGLPADGRLTVLRRLRGVDGGRPPGLGARPGSRDRIDLRIAPGARHAALRSRRTQPFDLAFIDADKPNYAELLRGAAARLRPNGVILVDNVLWDGRVVQADADDDNTARSGRSTTRSRADDRVDAVMLPIADGLTLCRKK